MTKLRTIVFISAITVLVLCVYSFLAGNGIFKGEFTNESFAWYFLAKGIFCSLTLYLLFRIIEKKDRL